MNAHNVNAERLLTWLDVERLLKQRTALWTQLPLGVLGINCFSSGMEIRYVADAAADAWLAQIFGRTYLRELPAIQLRIGQAIYPIEFVQDQASVVLSAGQNYPLWRDVTYLPIAKDDCDDARTGVSSGASPSRTGTARTPARFTDGPDLVSFHSFKGGVGRTTALMTYVAACMRETSPGVKKILVVDADLEAPGVSFWLDETNRPTVSFVQLLEALHYPPASLDASLDYFADELRKTSLSLGGLQRELFVLPAALDLAEIQDMPVAPEHLARNPENPWQLSDHLHALGKRLGVDAVFIDLRAGLSELASPILFDPRVDHFFVSTVAPQSVLGMAEVLRRLYASNHQLPPGWQDAARPTVVLSLLTKELREAGHYELALKNLGEAYPAEDTLTPSVQWLEAEFLSTLMSIGSLREALDSLPQSARLYASASEWAKSLYVQPSSSSTNLSTVDAAPSGAPSRQQTASKLREVCQAAEFAEGTSVAAILATEPLLNLGKHFAHELPNVLMIGAKGAGKTFTFRQVVQSKTWSSFLGKLGFDKTSVSDASIFPTLWSRNIEDKPEGEIKQTQGATLNRIGEDKATLLAGSELDKRIAAALQNPPNHWDDFWDDLIASQFGIDQGGLQALNEKLAGKSARVILVVDGIEDAFGDANADHARKAIEALLKLTNRISELVNPHLGAIVFVRLDYAQAAIRQNLGQWLQRFNPFRLHWNPESFLRLAYMLSSQADVHSQAKRAEDLNIDDLKTELEQLWGKKMGSEKSKEAHSARWVYAALCDLKGNVQARDLVRFLRISADEESKRPGQTWSDRVLAPESMRKAIPLCSVEKVNEAKTEISSLRNWVAVMAQQNIHNLKVPFSAAQSGLSAELLAALQELGVIYEDTDGNLGEDRLFLPEIYRSGLSIETSAAGRPRMQALLKKNIGTIPL